MDVGHILNLGAQVTASKQVAESSEGKGFIEVILAAMQNIQSLDINPIPVSELQTEDIENNLVEVEQFDGLAKLDTSSLLRKLIDSVSKDTQPDSNMLLEKLFNGEHSLGDKTLKNLVGSLINGKKEISQLEVIPGVQPEIPEIPEIPLEEEKTDNLIEEALIIGSEVMNKTFSPVNTAIPDKREKSTQANVDLKEVNVKTAIAIEAEPLIPEKQSGERSEAVRDNSFKKVFEGLKEKLTEASEKPVMESKIQTPETQIPPKSGETKVEGSMDIKTRPLKVTENKLDSTTDKEVKETNIKHNAVHHNMAEKSDSLIGFKPQETEKAPESNGIVKVNKEELLEVTVSRFKSLRLPDLTELRVRLKPEELGEIAIKVVLEKGQINGTITTSNKEVANMLQSNMDSLRQELKNNNLNLNNISVNVNNSGDFEGHSFSQQKGHDSRQFRGNAQNYKEQIESYKKFEEEEGINVIA